MNRAIFVLSYLFVCMVISFSYGLAQPAEETGGRIFWGSGRPANSLGDIGDVFFGVTSNECLAITFLKTATTTWQRQVSFRNLDNPDPNCPDPSPGGGNGGGQCPACPECTAAGAQDSHLFRATIDLDQTLGTLVPAAAEKQTLLNQERVINFNKDSGGPLKTTQAITSDQTPVFFDYCNNWSGHNWKADKDIIGSNHVNFVLENLTFERAAIGAHILRVRIKKIDQSNNSVILVESPPLSFPSVGAQDRIRQSLPYIETGPIEILEGEEVYVAVVVEGSSSGGTMIVLSGPRCWEDETMTTEFRCVEAGNTWIKAPIFYNQDTEKGG